MDWKKLAIATAAAFTLTTSPVEANKELIADHLESLPTDKHRSQARYFVTDHLVDSDYPSELLETYEHLLKFLINSVSWESKMLKIMRISETVFYFDMSRYFNDDFPWKADWVENWDYIEDEYPQEVGYAHQFADIIELTKSNVPIVRADWFLATASTGELYYDLLFGDDADTLNDLEHLLDIRFGVKIAAVKQSGVSFTSRAIEMYDLDRHEGRYWKSYDYRRDTEHDAVNDLIGEYGISYGDYDGGEMIFNLPNGLQGYYVADRFGNRITDAPTDIVQARTSDLKLDTELKGKEEGQVLIGVSCMTCHTLGINYFLDQAWNLGKHTNKFDFFLRDWDDERLDANEQYREAINKIGGQVGTTVAPYRIKDVYNNYDEHRTYAAPRKSQRKVATLWAKQKR